VMPVRSLLLRTVRKASEMVSMSFMQEFAVN
jgi:hypothetical protein